MCRREIFQKMVETPELWDINLYEDPHGDKHIYVSLIVRDAVMTDKDSVGSAMGLFDVPTSFTPFKG